MRWIDRLFSLEEINGGERCPTYLYRWTLWRAKRFSVYLHHFVGDDWSLDLHDHPKRFISIGLWGRYVEQSMQPLRFWRTQYYDGLIQQLREVERTYRAPWVRTFPATHIHRLQLIDGKPCWTLVIVLKPVRPWGFWHDGKFIGWREYVGSKLADKMKACD